MAVRIFSSDRQSNIHIAPEYAYARGIRKAADAAQVLSMSWTMGSPLNRSNVIEEAIRYALDKNRVLVFAAGNSYRDEVNYPANLSSVYPVIAVSAIDRLGKFRIAGPLPDKSGSWGSNYGPEISVAAPGENIYTSDNTGTAGHCFTGDYTVFHGTSAATPVVAGVAALVLSQQPDLTPAQVRERLQQTARHPTDALRPSDEYGWGIIDACRAVGGTGCG